METPSAMYVWIGKRRFHLKEGVTEELLTELRANESRADGCGDGKSGNFAGSENASLISWSLDRGADES